jgi:Ca2+-binding EF-hand superfamily protein
MAALLLGAWFAATPAGGQNPAPRPPAGQKPDAQAKDVPYEFVFLAEARPLLVRAHVRLDGEPVQAAWEGFVKHLFQYLDKNRDGVLTKDEVERMPPLEQILSGNLGVGGFGFGGGSASPAMEDLDTNRDGKVTVAELAAYCRSKGFVPFQFQGESKGGNPLSMAFGGGKSGPSVEAVSEAIFNLLDTNGDRKLSREELAAAPEVLLRLDADDDELVTARELVPKAPPKADGGAMFAMPGMLGAGGPPATGNRILMLVTTPGEAPNLMVRRMHERYGGKGSAEGTKLGRKALGLDEATFAALDTNRDGVLDAQELAAFVKRPPDLELVVRVGTRGSGERAVEAAAVKGRPSPLADKLKAVRSVALLDLGATRTELGVGEEYRSDRLSGVLQQQYGALFKQADKNRDGYIDAQEAQANALFRGAFKAMDLNGDGKVSEKEFNEYQELLRDLQGRARAACVTLVLADQSRGLFDLLDTDRDGRLSIREMRGAAALLARLDRDGKGWITRADVPRSYRLTVRRGTASRGGFDLSAVFEELYGGGGGGEVQEGPTAGPAWFRKMDRNRDGDVSRREWLGSEELFRRIDTDGDGLISAEEADRYDALHRKQK